MAGWALLVFAPRWRWSQRMASAIIPLTLAIVYLVLIVLYFAKSPGGFGTLAQVTQLFQNPWLLLAGWIHYLAFDLFLGAWQVRQAQRLGISHFLVIPCLLCTFFVGPDGFLVFWALVLLILFFVGRYDMPRPYLLGVFDQGSPFSLRLPPSGA